MKQILAVVCLIAGLGCGGATPHPVSSQPVEWNIMYSDNMPAHPEPEAGALWDFEFPGPAGLVGYILTDYVAASPPKSITTVFQVDYEAGTIFDYDLSLANGPAQGCFTPASVTFIIERQGDDMQNQDYRWWAGNTPLEQSEGQPITVVLPLTPDLWTNVEGKTGTERTSEFEAAVQNLGHVGLTMGGGCNYGHGVNLASGSAKFTLISYTIS